jgi:hypothetical protein
MSSLTGLTLERQIRPIYGVSAILYSLVITTAVATRRSGQWVPQIGYSDLQQATKKASQK